MATSRSLGRSVRGANGVISVGNSRHCESFRNALEACRAAKDWTPLGEDEPTEAQPGSEEKLHVLSYRIFMGLELWHPEDLIAKRPWNNRELFDLLRKEKDNDQNHQDSKVDRD